MQKMQLSILNNLLAALLAFLPCSIATATVLTTESFSLPSATNNSAAAPYLDMIVNTSPSLTTWGQKGAVGVQGAASQNLATNVTPPAATVAFKFNVGSAAAALNSAYGTGNWTIANPRLTFQYTYYSPNSVFGGGAGTFETYWVANDTWAFGNGPSAGNSFGTNQWISGTDPAYATSLVTLTPWAGSAADLGSATFNWLSPANNPNYQGWSTDKSGLNQGILTDYLTADPALVNDITSATATQNQNVSLYLMPTSNSLGLTIFTGGGTSNPTLSFDVISAPEPASLATLGLAGTLLFRRRR